MRLRYCLALFLATLALHAQTPPATDCAAGGTVVNALTGEPVARATVTMSAAGGTGTVTDLRGQWSITGQTCGLVTPSASRPGFLTGNFRRPGLGSPPWVQLVSGSPVHDLQISLMPEGSVAGKVQDESGDPIEGAQIRVLRVLVINGRRTLVFASGGTASDAQGNFRAGALPPGRYLVCAQSDQPTYPAGGGRAYVYAEDCFPGPVSSGPSIAAPVAGGREVNVVLTLRATQGVHVRGKVYGAPDAARLDVVLMSYQTGERPVPSPYSSFTAADGSFDIAAVPPGAYIAATAAAPAQPDGPSLQARTLLDVGNSDVDGLKLTLESPGSVSGTVRVERSKPASAPGSANAAAVDVSLNPVEPATGGAFGPAQWDANHLSFVFPQVTPTDYTLETHGTYVKSATLHGQDVRNQPFAANGAAGPIEIVVSDDLGRVNASITDAEDHPAAGVVILMPHGGFPAVIEAGDDGKATRQGIPTGEYTVWAFDDISNVPWAEDDWMAQHAGPGRKVTITTAGTANIAVKRVLAPRD